MEIEVRQITEPAIWEKFVACQPETLFVQSWQYGEFYQAIGESFRVLGVYRGDELVGGSLVLGVHAKRGHFLYLPYGPIVKAGRNAGEETRSVVSALILDLVKIARGEGYDFIRVSPFWQDTIANRELIAGLGFRAAPMHILAEHTWLLDLSPAEAELFSGMEKNHRNLVRRCQKEGVRISISGDLSAVSEFSRLHDETARRHNFHRFSFDYIKKEFQAMNQTGKAVVIHGYLPDGTLDSSGIFIYYGSMGSYRHGASLNRSKRLPTSYLVQWSAVQLAKKLGCRLYNFWGIAPEGASRGHPFYGITHFKKGFGGYAKPLVRCHDRPVTWRYWLNWLVEKFRSANRGFGN